MPTTHLVGRENFDVSPEEMRKLVEDFFAAEPRDLLQPTENLLEIVRQSTYDDRCNAIDLVECTGLAKRFVCALHQKENPHLQTKMLELLEECTYSSVPRELVKANLGPILIELLTSTNKNLFREVFKTFTVLAEESEEFRSHVLGCGALELLVGWARDAQSQNQVLNYLEVAATLCQEKATISTNVLSAVLPTLSTMLHSSNEAVLGHVLQICSKISCEPLEHMFEQLVQAGVVAGAVALIDHPNYPIHMPAVHIVCNCALLAEHAHAVAHDESVARLRKLMSFVSEDSVPCVQITLSVVLMQLQQLDAVLDQGLLQSLLPSMETVIPEMDEFVVTRLTALIVSVASYEQMERVLALGYVEMLCDLCFSGILELQRTTLCSIAALFRFKPANREVAMVTLERMLRHSDVSRWSRVLENFTGVVVECLLEGLRLVSAHQVSSSVSGEGEREGEVGSDVGSDTMSFEAAF